VGLDLGDNPPVGLSGEEIGAGAPVDSQGVHPAIFRDPEHFQGVDRAVVPAGADLDRQGDPDRPAHRPEDPLHAPKVPQQLAPSPLAHHLFDRAAAVDVHDVGPHLLDHGGCRRHPGGIRAEDLDGHRALLLPETGDVRRPPLPARHSLGAGQLRNHQPASPQALDRPTEEGIGVPRDRREDEGGVDDDILDLEHGTIIISMLQSFPDD